MCDICKDVGWLRNETASIDDPKFGKLEPCECKSKERAARLQRRSGLPENEDVIPLEQMTLDDRPGTSSVINACIEFVEDPHVMLTLWGGFGNGKSTAMRAVVQQCLDKNIESVYVNLTDLLGYIRAAFNQANQIADDDAYARLQRFASIPVLCIDEFDKARYTEWVEEQLSNLMDKRYLMAINGTGGTIIAMNNDPDTLPGHIYSRLRDQRNRIVQNVDKDIRPLMR